MVRGTDHWFLKPQVWDKVRVQHRRQILDDILDTSKDIGDNYRWTIFNQTKRDELARLGTAELSAEAQEEIQATLAAEGAKFTDEIQFGAQLDRAGGCVS